jgi:hypothetical protein
MNAATTEAPATRDLELQGACPTCGGDLSVRLGPEGARSVCHRCGAWSRPILHQNAEGLHLHHPTRAAA